MESLRRLWKRTFTLCLNPSSKSRVSLSLLSWQLVILTIYSSFKYEMSPLEPLLCACWRRCEFSLDCSSSCFAARWTSPPGKNQLWLLPHSSIQCGSPRRNLFWSRYTGWAEARFSVSSQRQLFAQVFQPTSPHQQYALLSFWFQSFYWHLSTDSTWLEAQLKKLVRRE